MFKWLSFNSATVVTPWKHRCRAWLEKVFRELQFGHGCDAVETCRARDRRMPLMQLQFGHGCDAVETSWNLSLGLRLAGFNSATVVTPWKRRSWHRSRSPRRWLQFGHGCDAVETSHRVSLYSSSATLQFGHGCDAVETGQQPIDEDRRGASIRPRL